MATYKLSNLDFNTPLSEQVRLEMSLKRIQGVRTVRISVPHKEFTVTWMGREPNINVLKEACTCVGFNLSRKA